MAAAGPIAIIIAALATFKAALNTASNIIDIFTMRTKMNAEKMVAISQNQELLAQTINKRKEYETGARVFETIGDLPLVGIAVKPFLTDPMAKLTRSIGENVTASVEAFLKTDKAYRERFEQIAKYSTRLAGERGESISAKVIRDVGEADVLGERLGNLARQQRDLDRVQQQIDTLKKFNQLQEQSNQIQEKTRELNVQLNEELKKNPGKVADKIKQIGKDKDTPLTRILDVAPKLPVFVPMDPNDPRMSPDRGRLNIPLIRGGF